MELFPEAYLSADLSRTGLHCSRGGRGYWSRAGVEGWMRVGGERTIIPRFVCLFFFSSSSAAAAASNFIMKRRGTPRGLAPEHKSGSFSRLIMFSLEPSAFFCFPFCVTSGVSEAMTRTKNGRTKGVSVPACFKQSAPQKFKHYHCAGQNHLCSCSHFLWSPFM